MNITDGLNAAQHQAVTADPGPVLVLAGPGSGKTRVLTRRIAYLVQTLNVEPWRILSVTFTNKAAREMRERVDRILGEESLRGIMMGTFHSTCARTLRRESDSLMTFGYGKDFVIFDSDDQKQVIKQALKSLNLDEKKFNPRQMSSHISKAKDKLITPDMYNATDYVSEVVKRVYKAYQETLVANNAMDFDDLIFNTVHLFDEVPAVLEKYQQRYQHILVDEFQDTNTAQYGLLTRLGAQHGNLFVVGDSDQSIYKWRGADFRNITRFRELYPTAEQVLLEQNYRSTQIILDAAKAVIQHNRERVHKELFTERVGGAKVALHQAYNESDEADWIIQAIAKGTLEGREPGDYAIMYRTNAQSRALEDRFMRASLPYRLVGATRFYGRREIKDMIAYLRLIHNPRDEISLRRVINTPRRSIGAVTVAKLLQWGETLGLQGGEALILLASDPMLAHPFKGRTLSALVRFGNLLNGWYMARETLSVGDLVQRVLEQTNYHDYLKNDDDEDGERWGNVLEFKGVAAATEEVTLSDFLEQVALVADVDDLEAGVNAPTLLTLHASKGLEFPIVFLAGVEDGILPHRSSFDEEGGIEEERRLFYVGMTRAKDKLYILRTRQRTLYGMSDAAIPSRFLKDIPGELVLGGNNIQKQKREAKDRSSAWNWSGNNSRKSGSRGTKAQYGGKRTNRPKPTPYTPQKPLPKPAAPTRPKPKPVVVARHKTGQKVSHSKFGEGIVIESKLTGNDEEITIAFTNAGIKKLVASFAKLEILDE